MPPSASVAPQEAVRGAGAVSQHQPNANGANIGDPAAEVAVKEAAEDAVPPIGDECQLPLDYAQSYGISAIRVLTTSQAPAW
jgi:hypothetical protein